MFTVTDVLEPRVGDFKVSISRSRTGWDWAKAII